MFELLFCTTVCVQPSLGFHKLRVMISYCDNYRPSSAMDCQTAWNPGGGLSSSSPSA
jgi:hypothetical protein